MSNLIQSPFADEVASVKLDENLSKVILQLVESAGMSQAELARELGYSRVHISTLLHHSEVGRHWKLIALCGVARVFHTTVSDLIAAAEQGAPRVETYLLGTLPRSKERLQRLIYRAFGYNGDYDSNHFDKLLEVTLRVSLLERALPDWTKSYYAGDIPDGLVMSYLRTAYRLTEDDPDIPYWAAMKEAIFRR